MAIQEEVFIVRGDVTAEKLMKIAKKKLHHWSRRNGHPRIFGPHIQCSSAYQSDGRLLNSITFTIQYEVA